MAQIDVVLKFASLAAAKADPVVQQYRDVIDDLFNSDSVIPDVKVWRASQDVNGAHTFLSGYYLLVSLTSEQASKVSDLQNLTAVQFVVNRDKANARQAGAVIKANVSNAVLQDLRMQPVFAGSDYPWGAWQ